MEITKEQHKFMKENNLNRLEIYRYLFSEMKKKDEEFKNK